MIESESRVVWRLLISIIFLPITVILVLLRRRPTSALAEPIMLPMRFALQAKATAMLIAVIIGVYVWEVLVMTTTQANSLIFRPENIMQLDLVPIVASWFLHASLLHLGGNILFLFVFGRVVESKLGALWLTGLFFASALISSIISGMMGQGGIGASGAIAGLIATAILLEPFYLTYLFFGIPVPIALIGWLGIAADISGVLVPKQDNIGHIAHLGGYAAVTLFMFIVSAKQRRIMRKGLAVNALMLILWAGYMFYGPKLI